MKKLIRGIVEFRSNVLPSYREKFSRLALGQSPDTLFVACSDSRVVPNLFASTDPGDLFVVRNMGNLIPCCNEDGHSSADESEAAAIEYSLLRLKVSDIIVCGHSECAAMNALVEGRSKISAPNMREWLRHGEDSLSKVHNLKFSRGLANDTSGNLANRVSQANVLQQIEHLKTYPLVREQLELGTVNLHGWWFELSTANVYAYDPKSNEFILIDEEGAKKIGYFDGI